jgi:hypothetical protein
MVWFRRRRVFLGTYVHPEPVEPAPVEQVVRDGMLIGDSVVRMALRNRLIVDALRDRRDFDRRRLSLAASREFDQLADHEWESAERLRFRRDEHAEEPDDDALEESRRREHLHRAMSDGFATRSRDAAVLAAIVERSRDEAWSDVAGVILRRAGERAVLFDDDRLDDRDPHYESDRVERLGALVAVDLTALAQERGVEL